MTEPEPTSPPIGTEAHYRLLCETLGVALIATDADLSIRTWNAAAARTFGAAADQMIGTPVFSIIPQDRRKLAERTFRRVMRTGETVQFDFQHRDRRGGARELAATVAPVLSETGERLGVSVCIRDITKRIQLQGQVAENRKMVALGEMAGAVAHHFNNILGGMVTSIDFVRRSDDPVMIRRVLDQVHESLQRATTLVDGLLAFAGGDRRTEDLGDFTEIMLALAEETEKEAAERGIEFRLDMESLPVMPFPHVPVLTLFRNIIRNALEAMPGGGILRVQVTRTTKDVVVTITDTGCGFDEQVKERIFEPFWTTKGVLQEGGREAAGLGLAITHGLIQMLGGSITARARLGKGAVFKVKLPIPKGD